MNEKIARDPFLREVCERWGEGAADEAGFFFDDDPGDAALDDVGWLSTPTEQVRRAVAATTTDRELPSAVMAPQRAGPPVVLVSTGGFFPVHGGHLQMMEHARSAATDAGWHVVGGYLSPAHDDYIRLKCGEVPVGVSQRLARAEAAVAPSGWLSVDPWEALARKVAVNYTDVTARLQRYLRAHVDPTIEVAFVGGGDNARFALAFATRGRAVFVGRPGSQDECARWRRDERIQANPHILWAEGTDAASSRLLRPVQWPPSEVGHLTLRAEDEWAVRTVELDATAWRTFQDTVRQEFEARVAVTTVRVHAHTVRDERNTISLDPMVPGTVDLGVSRLFDLGGHRPWGHVARPGSASLAAQCAAIPDGQWVLRDDDRATGSTVAFVESLLRPAVQVTNVAFAIDPAPRRRAVNAGTTRDRGRDLADCRDFLLGADDGGLVVALPDGSVGRAPYLLPYVDPVVRCGLPAGDAARFSHAIWLANAAAFATTPCRVGDLPAPTRATMHVAGHADDARVRDVCCHHAAVLANFIGVAAPRARAGTPAP